MGMTRAKKSRPPRPLSWEAHNTPAGEEGRLVFLGRLKDFCESSAQPCFPFRQQIELGGIVGLLQDFSPLVVFVHQKQYLLKAIGQRRRKILSHGHQVARQPLGFRQDGDLRSFLLVKPRIVVVTEGTGSDFFAEHPLDDCFLRVGKKVADVRWRSIGVKSALVGELESLARQKMPRQKVARSRFGIFERKGLTSQVLEAIYFTVSLGKNKASILRHA